MDNRHDHSDHDQARLTAPLTALLATEVFHIAATVANDGHPAAHHAQLGRAAHVAAVLVTVGLLVWTRRRGKQAAALTAVAGAAVVVAAVLYHVLPIESDVTNPFWDGATVAQQISVVAGIAAGAWCVAAGVRCRPGRRVAEVPSADRPTLSAP
jgi:hypothetical protein